MSDASNPLFLGVQHVRKIHDQQIELYGGEPGLKDAGLLESAVYAPKNLYLYENPDIFDLAACLAVHIALNHSFHDGNKRTGFSAAAHFLAINGIKMADRPKEPTHAQFTDARYQKLMELSIKKEVDAEFVASIFFIACCVDTFMSGVGRASEKFRASKVKAFTCNEEARAYLTQEFFTFIDEEILELCQQFRINSKRINEIDQGAREALIQCIDPKYQREFGMTEHLF